MAEPVSLGALSPAELAEVRQSLEQELRTMTQNAVTLQSTAAKFGAAGQAVEYLQDQKQGKKHGPACPACPLPLWHVRPLVRGSHHRQKPSLHRPPVGSPLTPAPDSGPPAAAAGQPVLLPLTESLYVSGKLESVDTVLLEIGTGYYVEVRRRRLLRAAGTLGFSTALLLCLARCPTCCNSCSLHNVPWPSEFACPHTSISPCLPAPAA